MPTDPAGAPIGPAGAPAPPRLPAGLWRQTTALLAACLSAAAAFLALAPRLSGSSLWDAAALAAACYAIARAGLAWQPLLAARWAVAAALLLGCLLALLACALSPFLPGIAIPALVAGMMTYCVLWGLHHDTVQPLLAPRSRIAASVLATPPLVYLLALVLSRYIDQDYLRACLAGTGLAGLFVNLCISTFLAVQVSRQAQLLAARQPPLPASDYWRAASGLLACLAGYCGDGAAAEGAAH